jgi:phosphoglycolate phosphatase-like HAD superfamily hydrolase
MPYAYYNVAGRDNMGLADGAKETLALCNSNDFIVGLATPIPEKLAQNMMERAKIDPKAFKFAEYGAFNRDANALLMAALSAAKAGGAEPDHDGVFVSSSPSMLSSARAVRIKTVAVTNGQDQRFEGIDLDSKIKSLREIRKAVQKVTV